VKAIYSKVKEDEYEHIKKGDNKNQERSASGEYFLHSNSTEFPYHARIIVYSIKICIIYAWPYWWARLEY
jgi:hypothetical protein